MATRPSDRAAGHLPVDRAFVVQIKAQADLAAGRLVGRVEHVVSGRAIRFRSLRQLVEFMDGATAMAQRKSPGGASGTTPRAKCAPRRGS
jgi:hypothetical protein